MQWFRRTLIMAVSCTWLIASASTHYYESAVADSEWRVAASVFECQLSHGVPYYGQAAFVRRAGESQQFVLRSPSPSIRAGQVMLASHPPPWKKRGEGRHLGAVSVDKDQQTLRLGAKLSAQILHELHRGMQVVLAHPLWYDDQGLAQVSISAVNFRAAYNRYTGCMAELLPVNFDQIERTAIYFGDGDQELGRSELAKLDTIAQFVAADDSISRFYVDGHTDSAGSRLDNFELSRRRAELITAHLVHRGIPEEAIVTRWHGERYPVASNNTAAGRAENRRVTIRLVRGDGPVEGGDFAAVDELALR